MSRLLRSASAFFRSLPRKASAIAAALVLLVAAFFVLMTVGADEGSESGGGMGLSPAALRSVALGSSRSEVERRLGAGQDAFEWPHTGIALEPMDATCTYYLTSDDLFDVVQLCYRDDALVSKRTYTTPRPG